MGYVLPVQPIQSQMYANRLQASEMQYHYATTVRVSRVEMDSRFLDVWTALEERQKQRQKQRNKRKSSSEHRLNPIYPNPAKLSPIIAQTVGKGMAINQYV